MDSSEQNGTEKKKGSLLIKLVILVVILGALGGGGFFAYKKFFKHDPDKQAEEKHVEKVFFDMDSFLVNLADAGGKRYLKITMKFELNNAKVSEEMKNRNFEVRDAVLMTLSAKEFDDIAPSSGKGSLKREIMTVINGLMKQGQVVEVFFTDFIVQ
jgi:flagellar protein FliL